LLSLLGIGSMTHLVTIVFRNVAVCVPYLTSAYTRRYSCGHVDAVWLPPEVAVEQIRSGDCRDPSAPYASTTLTRPAGRAPTSRNACIRRRRVLNFMAGVIARGLDLAIHRKKSISCEPDGYEGQSPV